ncbi:MAG TPA: DsbE family thiol:disulfide interchange protein [Burkholderiaceae bacterium]
MRALKFLLPLAVFLGLGAFLLLGLDRNPRELPSPLLGKAAPLRAVPHLDDPSKSWSPEQMRGKVWLLNIWGSWCAGCQVEHPVLNDFARTGLAPLVGMAWRDKPDASKAWLARLGDPYEVSLTDPDGLVAIDWGVYGAPETFLVDKAGIIRYKHIGPIDAQAMSTKLVPMIKEWQAK